MTPFSTGPLLFLTSMLRLSPFTPISRFLCPNKGYFSTHIPDFLERFRKLYVGLNPVEAYSRFFPSLLERFWKLQYAVGAPPDSRRIDVLLQIPEPFQEHWNAHGNSSHFPVFLERFWNASQKGNFPPRFQKSVIPPVYDPILHLPQGLLGFTPGAKYLPLTSRELIQARSATRNITSSHIPEHFHSFWKGSGICNYNWMQASIPHGHVE